MTKGLTAKQQRFVDEYLKDCNATQACIRAGYSAKNADKIGPELLGKTRVAEAVQQALKEQQKRTQITADMVIKELARIGFSDIKNYAKVADDGSIRITNFDQLPDDSTRVIKKIKEKKTVLAAKEEQEILNTTLEFDLYDKVKALELLGKHFGIFDGKQGIEDDPPETDPLIEALGDSAATDWGDDADEEDAPDSD